MVIITVTLDPMVINISYAFVEIDELIEPNRILLGLEDLNLNNSLVLNTTNKQFVDNLPFPNKQNDARIKSII